MNDDDLERSDLRLKRCHGAADRFAGMQNGYRIVRRGRNGASPEPLTHRAINRYLEQAAVISEVLEVGRHIDARLIASRAADHAAALRAAVIAHQPDSARAQIDAAHQRFQAARRP